ncbi:MAG: M48 family metalloprotease, partial [Candidatus Diapherotrites archaeon]|nr:M48 family metalloprotease [Candidatus Diapherotrites archaeon]
MIGKLAAVSLATLGALLILLFGLLATVFFFIGAIDGTTLILITLIFAGLSWLLGPIFQDFVLGFFYKMQWIGLDKLREKDPAIETFILDLCKKYKIKQPKIGFIQDDNPTAFTYGSDHWNARLIFSNGILKYLDKEEVQGVLAHEIGHIVHRDFIVMTIASVIVTLMYEIYWIFRKSGQQRSGSRKGGGATIIIAGIAYVFYIIGTYLLLYLSRTREYFADEFSGENSSPNALSTGLIKIAYGIIAEADTDKTTRLLNSTRAMGLYDHKTAMSYGMTYIDYKENKNSEVIEKSMVFDIKNPWAFFSEINSTHPLTGKRLLKLAEQAETKGEKRFIDADKVKNFPIDKQKMYQGFITGAIIGTGIGKLIVFTIALIIGVTFFGTAGLGFAIII